MDLEKFTDRARGFLQAAQTIALLKRHFVRCKPAHFKPFHQCHQARQHPGQGLGGIHAGPQFMQARRRSRQALSARGRHIHTHTDHHITPGG